MDEQYLFVGVLAMYLQRWLKRFDWYGDFVTWAPAADRWIHRIVAGLFALIGTVGISYVVVPNATTGGWDISMSIPSVAAMASAAWAWVQAYTTAQLSYEMTRKPVGMPHDQPVTDLPLKKRMGH